MNNASIMERCKTYTTTAISLIKHPFQTIRYLLTLDDEGDYLLYAVPLIVLNVFNLLITTVSKTMAYLPNYSDLLDHSFWSLLLSLTGGYIGWRFGMFILWNALHFVGGNGSSTKLRIGTLHIEWAYVIIQMAVCLLVFLLSLITSYGITFMIGGVLQLVIFIAAIWSAVLTIKFMKELNNISYGKTILAVCLPTIVMFGIFFLLLLPLFH